MPIPGDFRGSKPLQGVRVLDLTRLIPGPFASLVLADLGATVDKVEDTGGGDYLRHFPPLVSEGYSAGFAALNRGKRSLVLDLKHERGREVFAKLLTGYDALFEQFRPGVLERLGFGFDRIRELNPKLIVCSLTGYGQDGPLAQRAGHDLNYLARAGLLGLHGPADAPPQVPGWQMADVGGGLWAVVGILAALMQRERSQKGCHIDIAMSDSVQGFASASFGAILAGVMPPRGDDLLTGGIAPYNTYLSRDGAPMTIAALEPKFWTAFCTAVGIEPDMAALMPGPHQAELKRKLSEIFASKTRAEWEAFAEEHDCCVEPVLRPDELREDPHLKARNIFFSLETANGSLDQFRTPVTPLDENFSPPPKSGEHSETILREAGIDDAQIAELRALGVVR